MSYHIQSSFAAGEIDPALHERTTFDKYQSGLAALRNTVIGKTGRPVSRPGLPYFKQVKSATANTGTFTADAGSNLGTKIAHGLGTGTVIRVSSTGTLPTGLVANTDYYAVYRGPDDFGFAVSLSDALLAEYDNFYLIDLLSAGTGVLTVIPTDIGDKKSILYSPPYTQYLLEVGHRNCRTHNLSNGTYVDCGHPFTEDDLDYIQFTTTKDYVYFTRLGYSIKRLSLSSGAFAKARDLFITDHVNSTFGAISLTGTGYDVDYAFTFVYNGEESPAHFFGGVTKLPQTVAEANEIASTAPWTGVTEVRAYRQPLSGSAYGFIGSVQTDGAGNWTFIDYGQDADFTHSPPTLDFILYNTVPNHGPVSAAGRAACIYQQKLIMTRQENEEAINASRTGYLENFLRDYPLAADSALTFKCGSAGNARVLRMIDNDGLLIFTTVGIFRHSGGLSPSNLTMDKVGNWVIEETVAPLEIPGGIIFVDKKTNTVRTLIRSNEAEGFPGDEISIFSNHLFLNKKVKSWSLQGGDIPLVWVVMDDGSLNALTYQRENKMQAWSRHDTDGTFESVAVVADLTAKDVSYFIVNRNGVRHIEYTAPRFVGDIKEFVGMDAAVSLSSNLAEDGATITVTPQDVTDWEGLLDITSDEDIFTNTADNGAVGSVFRFFDSQGSAVDLEVTVFNNTKAVTVQPLQEFPSEQTQGIKLYKTYNEITGLDHLNNKIVSVMVDGYIYSSPNNNLDNYQEITVQNGKIFLPNNKRGAFVHVGLPFTSDIETLDVDTVEQKPALLESIIVHQVFLKVYNTRGLYMGTQFSDNDKVETMVDIESRNEVNGIIIGGAAQQPYTKRLNLSLPNDWKSHGRICLRQVDPLPMEILSIIPDLTVYI